MVDFKPKLPWIAVGVSHFTKDLKTGSQSQTQGIAIRDAEKRLILEMSPKVPVNEATALAKLIAETMNKESAK